MIEFRSYQEFQKTQLRKKGSAYADVIIEYLRKRPTPDGKKWVRWKDLRDAVVKGKDNSKKTVPLKMIDGTTKEMSYEDFYGDIAIIPGESTFINILGKLVDAGFVEKRSAVGKLWGNPGPGRSLTVYRAIDILPDDPFWTVGRQSLLSDQLLLRLRAAEGLLKSYHPDDPGFVPEVEIDEYGMRTIPFYDELMRAKTDAEFLKIFQKKKILS